MWRCSRELRALDYYRSETRLLFEWCSDTFCWNVCTLFKLFKMLVIIAEFWHPAATLKLSLSNVGSSIPTCLWPLVPPLFVVAIEIPRAAAYDLVSYGSDWPLLFVDLSIECVCGWWWCKWWWPSPTRLSCSFSSISRYAAAFILFFFFFGDCFFGSFLFTRVL